MGSAVLGEAISAIRAWSLAEGTNVRPTRAASVFGSLVFNDEVQQARLPRASYQALKRTAGHGEPLDLSGMAEDIIAELQQGDPARRVELDIEPGLGASGDSTLVRNMLGNLLGNAWKFTRDTHPARITFRRVMHAGEAWFEVADNGIGFEQAYASKLFRPFQRLHAADQFAGEGVGLASVKRIVERHGGVISGEGVHGAGARFRFTVHRSFRAARLPND